MCLRLFEKSHYEHKVVCVSFITLDFKTTYSGREHDVMPCINTCFVQTETLSWIFNVIGQMVPINRKTCYSGTLFLLCVSYSSPIRMSSFYQFSSLLLEHNSSRFRGKSTHTKCRMEKFIIINSYIMVFFFSSHVFSSLQNGHM